jgi:hypothetical protein
MKSRDVNVSSMHAASHLGARLSCRTHLNAAKVAAREAREQMFHLYRQ